MPLVVNLRARKANFTLAGPDVEPAGDRWRGASDAERLWYFTTLAGIVRRIKQEELAAGIGADGRPLPRVRPESRERYRSAGLDWTGPPLAPRREDSRVRRLLQVRPFPARRPTRVTGYWLAGWGQVMQHHALGRVRGAPPRDVVGLSPDNLRRAVAVARSAWTRRHRWTPVPTPMTWPTPGPPPRHRRRVVPPPRPAASP